MTQFGFKVTLDVFMSKNLMLKGIVDSLLTQRKLLCLTIGFTKYRTEGLWPRVKGSLLFTHGMTFPGRTFVLIELHTKGVALLRDFVVFWDRVLEQLEAPLDPFSKNNNNNLKYPVPLVTFYTNRTDATPTSTYDPRQPWGTDHRPVCEW